MPEDQSSVPSPSDPTPEVEHDRTVQAVDAEEPPRLPFLVVGIGASAGGLEAFTEFFKTMPSDSGMAFVLVQHLPPDRESLIADLLSRHTKMVVQQVEDGMPVLPNNVYIIRPGHTLTLKEGRLHLGERLDKPRHSRPVDDFFKSLAEEQRERAICIIMSGMGSNGAAGAQAVKAVGGICIAQEPETAAFPSMPRHLIDAGYSDYILRPNDMPEVLIGYAHHPYARGQPNGQRLQEREQQHLREILAVLRTRTRHDYSGYKKQTILRRIQRRMGVNRITKISEYATILRQSPVEVTALADDLLIHVTGFFRDPEAWEHLRERVIVPLIAAREPGTDIRCWVTACSSGEEAYTLAMLLVEEIERAGKPLDIKIFATDTAERTLSNARNGIFPGGIEAEMTPARLERFFQRDDAVYRIRQELREKVVFAPQNVLQDPPFSRLDIVTCRNLLIYLEPDVQQKVIAILHFGLREGGALFLGNSETIPNDERLFEPIDKKVRIYRRIGPTRHGSVEFPLPHNFAHTPETARADNRAAPKLSIAQLTNRELLNRHLSAAITVDRDYRAVYFHGNTQPYINQPTGEPSRELIPMLVESVRGAVRTALHRAASQNVVVTVPDGWLDTMQGKRRIFVTASPMENANPAEYFVLSFEQRIEIPHLGEIAGRPDGNAGSQTELRSVQDELQTTIDDLQSSNEEYKASVEEVMSVNEELQSTNEELETSKEEMQSLNEELAMVNAQLQAKMEEHQTSVNDLSSLLSSTDIAVIFLDTQFRIRWYTPAAKHLLELIISDVGRPLNDLAKKFTDPHLLIDAQRVLEKLIPLEAEISSDASRWYLRRVLPYRTVDNRIDGVVITFVDITERKLAEFELKQGRARVQQILDLMPAAVYTCDDQGRITFYNKQAAKLWGREPPIGTEDPKYCGAVRLWQSDGAPLQAADSPMARAVRETASIRNVELTMERPDGSRARVNIKIDPLLDENATFTGTINVLEDITDRKESEDTLQAAKDSAENANRIKDDFLATLSHELRTPLSAVLLWGKTLRDTPMTAVEQKEGLDAIISSAEAQAGLIEDLLDTSRISAGKIRLEPVPVRLEQIVMSAVETIKPTAEAKNIRLASEMDPKLGTVRADGERLRQVIWNLLTNAVKFTPFGGKVSVTAVRIADDVEIRVSDTGRGISAEFLPHVFERFSQFEGAGTRKKGLGLGLAISKQLVELHGGTLSCASAGTDSGATFTIKLPLPVLPEAKAKGQPAPAQVRHAISGLKMLVVEDDAATLEIIKKVLHNAGARVTGVANAADGLTQYMAVHPDLLISDINLPDTDGYTLLQQIRAHEIEQGFREVPAIAMTAYARDEDRRKAADAGFHLHLAKPVGHDSLFAALDEVLFPKQK